MIKVYNNGKEFLDENTYLLNENRYLNTFIFLDAELLSEANKINYAIRVEFDNKVLLGLRLEPFDILLYGDNTCLDELFNFLDSNNYYYEGFQCSTVNGDYLVRNYGYTETLAMDFMIAKEKTEKSSNLVTIPTICDLDTLYEYSLSFAKECGITLSTDKEHLKNMISSFRVLRENGRIVSMAKMSLDASGTYRITHVYTHPDYRNQGYARLVVNTIKNEIIALGTYATLNVDKKNPISNHLYLSLGFTKLFSLGVYKK